MRYNSLVTHGDGVCFRSSLFLCISFVEGRRSQGKKDFGWRKPIRSLTRQQPQGWDPSNLQEGGCAAREQMGAHPASPTSGHWGLQLLCAARKGGKCSGVPLFSQNLQLFSLERANCALKRQHQAVKCFAF